MYEWSIGPNRGWHGSSFVMEGTTIEVTGIVRRRRNFSRRLSFFDVEEESTGLRIQLVVDGWEVKTNGIKADTTLITTK